MRRFPDPLPPGEIRAECDECEGTGRIACDTCHGDGATTCECDSCGHEHDRECRDCDGDGTWICEECLGFGCTEAGKAWAHDQVLPLIPSDILRLLLRVAPRLDAGGLPRFGVRCELGRARPVVTVQFPRAAADLRDQLAAYHFTRACECPKPRAHMDQWTWRGDSVALPERRWSA